MASPPSSVQTPIVLGVAGSPDVVAASLSPVMFRAAFDELGRDSAWYVPLALRERSAGKALRGLARLGFRGCNVTMPFKRVAAQIAHTPSERVARCGMANTLVVEADGTLRAEATDGSALVELVSEQGVELHGGRAVIVGAGGSAYEAADALAEAGIARIDIWNRTRTHAEALAQHLQNSWSALELQVSDRMPIREPAHVLVGCVPADAIEPRAYAGIDAGTLIADFAYRRDGRPTPLMVTAEAITARAIDGRALLVRQAAHAWRCWFDDEPPIEVMNRAVR